MKNPIPKMSHVERGQRRRDIAAAVASGKDATAVAISYGVSRSLIQVACRENGVSILRKWRVTPWQEKVMETIEKCGGSQIAAAKELGITRQRVSEIVILAMEKQNK